MDAATSLAETWLVDEIVADAAGDHRSEPVSYHDRRRGNDALDRVPRLAVTHSVRR